MSSHADMVLPLSSANVKRAQHAAPRNETNENVNVALCASNDDTKCGNNDATKFHLQTPNEM